MSYTNNKEIKIVYKYGGCKRKQYEQFLDNDEELALKYGTDYSFFKSRHYEIEK